MALVSPHLSIGLLGACLLAALGCWLGLLLVRSASLSRAERSATLAAGCLTILAGAAALFNKPWQLWCPALVVSVGWLLLRLNRCLWRQVLAWPATRRFGHWKAQTLALLAVAPQVLAAVFLPTAEADIPVHHSIVPVNLPEAERPQSCSALTDRSTAIPLVRSTHRQVALNPEEVEQAFVTRLTKNHPVSKTAPADPSYNCHGWVFTGGEYCLDGLDVERILVENGYDPVTAPRPGDLAIYRTPFGVLNHTALVRVVTEEGLVLVESKWGPLGRYLHPADKVEFAGVPTYHRSSRSGHLLLGLSLGDKETR